MEEDNIPRYDKVNPEEIISKLQYLIAFLKRMKKNKSEDEEKF